MLQPMSLLSDAMFEPAGMGSVSVAGRRAIFEVAARPRRQWYEHTDPQLWDGPDEYRLLVDAARGILLRVTGYFQGRAIAGREMLEVQFDAPLPPQQTRWQAVGEIVNLLYGAQYNFATVRAVVTERGYGRISSCRLWAANPDRWRAEHPEGDDGNYAVTTLQGCTWWRYSPRWRQAHTNAAAASLPAHSNAKCYRERPAPGRAVYEIRDGKYGIIAEWTLNPSPLLYALWLEPMGRTICAGREAIRVCGAPNATGGHR